MQHTLAIILLSLLLLIFLAGASTPLWIRKEQTLDFLTGLFMWFVPAGCILFGGVIIWTGLSDYFGGATESRWTVFNAILAIVLVSAGSSIIYEYSIKRRMEQIELQKLRQRHPESPWMWNRRWRNNTIEYSDTGEVIISYLISAVMILGMALSYFIRKEDILKSFQENRLDSHIILYLLVIGGFFALRYAFTSTMRWRRFKRSSFIMSTFPGVTGGMLEGELQTWNRHVPCEGFEMKLSCIEMDITFRKSFQSITEHVLWESKKNVRIEDVKMGTHGIAFPVSFSIPADAEESDTSSRDRRVHWVLTVNSTGNDCCFTAVFKIPVFRSNVKDTINNAPSFRN